MVKKFLIVTLGIFLSVSAVADGWRCKNMVGGYYKFTLDFPGASSGRVEYQGPLAPFRYGMAVGRFRRLQPFKSFKFSAKTVDGASLKYKYDCRKSGWDYSCTPLKAHGPVRLVNCQISF